MGIHQSVDMLLMESCGYHGSIFVMGSISEEGITEIRDRSPVQNDLDPIRNMDENKQRVLIGPI